MRNWTLIVYSYAMLFILVFLWLFLMVRSKLNQQQLPWDFIFVIISVVFANTSVVFFGNIKFGINWLVLFCFIYLKRKILPRYFISRNNIGKSILIGGILGLVMYFGGEGLRLLNISVLEKVHNISNANFWLQVTETAICEEVFFRCVTMVIIIGQNIDYWKTNIIQAFLFSFIHLPRYIISGTCGGLIIASIFGLLSGYIIIKTKNGWGCIVAHGLMNSLLFIVT